MSEIVLSVGFLVAFTVAMLVNDRQRAKQWDATMAEMEESLAEMSRIAERRKQYKFAALRESKRQEKA